MPFNKRKLLIVSSFGRPCGIAQYVEYLLPSLERYDDLDIEVASLPVNLLRSNSPMARKKSRALMNDIARKCAEADVVNIQFEHGLYGILPKAIWKNLKKIVLASRKVIVTHHTSIDVSSVSYNFNLNSFRAAVVHFRRNWVIKKLVSLCNKKKNCYHIVHTIREKDNMMLFLGVDESNIFDHPLSFLSQHEKKRMMSLDTETERGQLFGSSMKNRKLVGLFGFLHKDKGIETAIKALPHMPEDYSLIIVGGLHPEGIVKGEVNQPYIAEMSRLIMKSKLDDIRIRFIGSVDNDTFVRLMNAVDIVAFPYSEVHQTSSGAAAVALDLQKSILCARNSCFLELAKYTKEGITFFEISNALEFAHKVESLSESLSTVYTNTEHYGKIYNVETRAKLYHTLVFK